MSERQPRDTWLYELRHGLEIVYYGISSSPEQREHQHQSYGKEFTRMKVITVGLTRASAEERERTEIQRYQRQHGGRPPKYNTRKTY